MQIDLKIKKLRDTAILPKYQSDGAACFDLHYAPEVKGMIKYLTKGQSMSFATGLSVEIPKGFVMLVFSRSGHGFKNSVSLVNSVGVIDSDYRGEIKVGLKCSASGEDLTVNEGDRIAQAMLLPIPVVNMIETEQLNETERGDGGFGSTGK